MQSTTNESKWNKAQIKGFPLLHIAYTWQWYIHVLLSASYCSQLTPLHTVTCWNSDKARPDFALHREIPCSFRILRKSSFISDSLSILTAVKRCTQNQTRWLWWPHDIFALDLTFFPFKLYTRLHYTSFPDGSSGVDSLILPSPLPLLPKYQCYQTGNFSNIQSRSCECSKQIKLNVN